MATKAPAKAPAKGGKKKTFKKKEKKIVPVGVVHVQASFNNTIITITDPDGERAVVVQFRVRWDSADRARALRSPRSRRR